MRIDAHHHLWDTAARDHAWMDGPWADPIRGRFDTVRYTETAGAEVAESIVVQALHDEHETADLLAGAGEPVAGVVGWVDLTAPDVAERLAKLRDGECGRRLVGIRHLVQDEPDPRWLLREDTLRGVRAVRDAGLVYDVLIRPPQADAALEFARRLPEIRLVLDHLGKPDIAGGVWEPWASWITAMAALPNVTVKLSGLVTEAAPGWRADDLLLYARHALAAFGPERTMYGSDWPVCTLAAPHEQVAEIADRACADLDAAGHDAVFGGTAGRVYGLRPKAIHPMNHG
ncbi:amidohydrolase [Actinomadura darangshiensis]|uniref:Amidohydrolase n=1 Tax=Actinomadura darangshiensis TaxID=705336 RepID=A0A4R5BNA7_9ACTN|nr:amidohydrolase family protein [Actinomadura darangshiensis]TDD88328.1 amidohydrolase [Actinomadura darangshiensis]